MNVFSAGKSARCYQNWNGICWNREAVAMEKWSNTAPCSCHALMSKRFFFSWLRQSEKRGEKSSGVEKVKGWKGDRVKEVRKRGKWAEGEFWGVRIEKRIMWTVCVLVWLRWSQPDGFHEQDLTPAWSAFCRHITSSFTPPSSILSSLYSAPHPHSRSVPTTSKWSLILCHFTHRVSL